MTLFGRLDLYPMNSDSLSVTFTVERAVAVVSKSCEPFNRSALAAFIVTMVMGIVMLSRPFFK